MTKKEAFKLLSDAPADDKPSKVNKSLTRYQAVRVMMGGIEKMKDDDILNELFVKRVHQVCQDRIRPDIWLR